MSSAPRTLLAGAGGFRAAVRICGMAWRSLRLRLAGGVRARQRVNATPARSWRLMEIESAVGNRSRPDVPVRVVLHCKREVMGDGGGMRLSLLMPTVFVRCIRFRTSIRDACKATSCVRRDRHLGHTITQYPWAVRREGPVQAKKSINSITESSIAAPTIMHWSQFRCWFRHRLQANVLRERHSRPAPPVVQYSTLMPQNRSGGLMVA
jgi:hypothetical protein